MIVKSEGKIPSKMIYESFKVNKCTIPEKHNLKQCFGYHNEKDQRRSPAQFKYSAELCSKPEGICKLTQCQFAHNKVEQLYHEERYKKKLCSKNSEQTLNCPYGSYCSFAHNENELSIKLIHNLIYDDQFNIYIYKTVMCPFVHNHDKVKCVYAHNVQDLRRDPEKFQYSPEECPFWVKSDITQYEKGGCKNLMNCNKCHGWKELDYHPLVYKTKRCTNKDCLSQNCAYQHPGDKKMQKTSKEMPSSNSKTNYIQPIKPNHKFMPKDKQLFFQEQSINAYSTNVSSRATSFDSSEECHGSRNHKYQSGGSNYSSDSPEEKGDPKKMQNKPRKPLKKNSKPFDLSNALEELGHSSSNYKSHTAVNTPENKSLVMLIEGAMSTSTHNIRKDYEVHNSPDKRSLIKVNGNSRPALPQKSLPETLLDKESSGKPVEFNNEILRKLEKNKRYDLIEKIKILITRNISLNKGLTEKEKDDIKCIVKEEKEEDCLLKEPWADQIVQDDIESSFIPQPPDPSPV